MRPHDLATAADALRTANHAFNDALDKVQGQADNATHHWTGAGGEAAHTRAIWEVRAGRRIAGQVDDVISAFEDGAKRLDSARTPLLSAVDEAEHDKFSVDDANWTVHDTQHSEDREELRKTLQSIITARLATLVSEDEAVGFAIDKAIHESTATAEDVAKGRDYTPPQSLVGLSPEQLQQVLNDPNFQEWVHDHRDAAKPLLDAAFDAGQIPQKYYRDFLQDYWYREALEQAGIDPNHWDPTKGTAFNADTIAKVYKYYGELFLNHPELQWAGMANMIGPSFAGGFYDLNMLKQLASRAKGLPGLPGLAGLSEPEIKWYETRFLAMQQEIFKDQASMHEAYLHGGLAEMNRMARAGLIDHDTLAAWQNIHDGNIEHNGVKLTAGNRYLLYREQHDIIQPDYQAMYNRPVTGPAVTYALTAVGEPSIPGAHSFGQVFPQTATVTEVTPFGEFTESVTTGLPDGNIANFNDRWALIDHDTLPAYQRLLAVDPDGARDIVASDFGQRLDAQRLSHQWEKIIERLDQAQVGVQYQPPSGPWPWEW